jgi:hypothetical protein
LYRAILG